MAAPGLAEHWPASTIMGGGAKQALKAESAVVVRVRCYSETDSASSGSSFGSLDTKGLDSNSSSSSTPERSLAGSTEQWLQRLRKSASSSKIRFQDLRFSSSAPRCSNSSSLTTHCARSSSSGVATFLQHKRSWWGSSITSSATSGVKADHQQARSRRHRRKHAAPHSPVTLQPDVEPAPVADPAGIKPADPAPAAPAQSATGSTTSPVPAARTSDPVRLSAPLCSAAMARANKLYDGVSQGLCWASATACSIESSVKSALLPSCCRQPLCMHEEAEEEEEEKDQPATPAAPAPAALETVREPTSSIDSSAPAAVSRAEPLLPAPALASAASASDSSNTAAVAPAKDSEPSPTPLQEQPEAAKPQQQPQPQQQQEEVAAAAPAAEPLQWSFGSAALQNGRSHMEDRVLTACLTEHPAFAGIADRAVLVAVFDGHAGEEAAQHAAASMVAHLASQGPAALQQQPAAALARAISLVDADLLAAWRPECGPASGSTVCVALLLDSMLHIAHAGDSRAVLAQGARVALQTIDHKPSCPIEAQRIRAADPQADVSTDGYLYGLGVSRGLGSAHTKADPSKAAYVATPEVASQQLGRGDDFVVLATDGVWDKVSSQEAVAAVRRSLADASDPAAAAQALAERAQKLGSQDNIAVVVLNLHGRGIMLPKSNSRLFARRAAAAPAPASAQPAAAAAAQGGEVVAAAAAEPVPTAAASVLDLP